MDTLHPHQVKLNPDAKTVSIEGDSDWVFLAYQKLGSKRVVHLGHSMSPGLWLLESCPLTFHSYNPSTATFSSLEYEGWILREDYE